MQARFLDWEEPLEEDMGTHSSILAWGIPWTEEPGGLQSMGLQRIKHNWNNLAGVHTGLYQPDAGSIHPSPWLWEPKMSLDIATRLGGRSGGKWQNCPWLKTAAPPFLLWWFFPLGSEKTPWQPQLSFTLPGAWSWQHPLIHLPQPPHSLVFPPTPARWPSSSMEGIL